MPPNIKRYGVVVFVGRHCMPMRPTATAPVVGRQNQYRFTNQLRLILNKFENTAQLNIYSFDGSPLGITPHPAACPAESGPENEIAKS